MLPEFITQQTKILENIYTDLAQPGVKKVGLALESVLGLAVTVALPFKLINERADLAFSKNMERYKEKLNNIDQEKIAVVPPELGVPLINRLTYTTNELISEMFINLLSRASSVDTSNLAHPSFIDVISNLSLDEAKIISYFLERDIHAVPYIYFKAFNQINDNNYMMTERKNTGLEDVVDLLYPENLDFYLDNLVKIGILEDQGPGYNTSDKEKLNSLAENYNHILKAFEAKLMEINKEGQTHYKSPFKSPKTVWASFKITVYGLMFINACAAEIKTSSE